MYFCAEDDGLCITVRRTTVDVFLCGGRRFVRVWNRLDGGMKGSVWSLLHNYDMGNVVGLGNGGIHGAAGSGQEYIHKRLFNVHQVTYSLYCLPTEEFL
jgi:hypothetical protein